VHLSSTTHYKPTLIHAAFTGPSYWKIVYVLNMYMHRQLAYKIELLITPIGEINRNSDTGTDGLCLPPLINCSHIGVYIGRSCTSHITRLTIIP
jgi:hypothetical protein